MAAFGALVVVISAAMSLATQETITYETRPAPMNGSASIRAIRHWGMDETRSGKSAIDVAVVMGMLDSGKLGKSDGIPTCSSAECNFPTFDSLAVCATFTDITSGLQVKELSDVREDSWTVLAGGEMQAATNGDLSVIRNATRGYTLSLPNNFSFTTPLLKTVYLAPLNHSVAFTSQDDAYRVGMLDMIAVIRPGFCTSASISCFYASEVLLHMCVNTYNVSVSNNTAMTRVVSSHSKPRAHGTGAGRPIECAGANATCATGDGLSEGGFSQLAFTVGGVNYSIDARSAETIGASFAQQMSGWGYGDQSGRSVYSGLSSYLLSGVDQLQTLQDRIGNAVAAVNRE